MLFIAVAVWRLSYMIVEEDGPYAVFINLRQWVGADDEGDHPNPHMQLLRGILECIYCASVWIGIFFAVVYVIQPVVALYIAIPFALSGLAIFLDKAHG